ncbi:MAG: S-adenosylmethionine decarboxylase [Gemmatimonadaceae bacterium]|nr:S-adenosylmethionine decarboxylase [Gemmatimonadaceae bacterium]
MNGSEWVVEAYGCDPVRLGDVGALGQVFDALVEELSLHPVGNPLWHRFPMPGGVTGMLMLAESHLTVHTFPEHASLCVNLFCCTARKDWDWSSRLAELVGATDVRVRRLERVYALEDGRWEMGDGRRSDLQRLPSPVSILPSESP